ncbi:Acyl dehydratase [Sanguibacter gelidistatuariae]|uniref:Acyl dehydratase n=1 Tax=Sanguibacter gelidistatuariae TaxID=1814289 RepID=A0A1G6HDV7_9MICO|nr:MaoC/PaaZ C-terminal domain-containing protein [Sanguibacter gelidistatuariae]SDB92462.1 Acyl dehydratase [Sanguibacter gelidistatuariae]
MGPDMVGRPSAVKTLPGVPELGGLYARAVLPGWPRLPGRSSGASPDHASLPDVTYRVADVVADPEQLLRYQRLLGEPADDALPAGFVHVLAFPVAMALMIHPDFPLPLAGMVHLANAVTMSRVIRADERLEVHAWARRLALHPRGTQVELVTEVSARYGAGDAMEVVWRGVSTYLAKGVERSGVTADPVDADPVDADPVAVGAPVADAPAVFTPPMPTARWTLDAGTGRRYAAVSGDRNPIHLSALTAKAFGFPRAIAHGMYTAARALAESGAGRGGAFEWTVVFAKPVLLPGTVAVSITGDDAGGFVYSGWNARSGKEHFSGTVTPT